MGIGKTKFKNVIHSFDNGYIAVVDKSCSKQEKLLAAQFSERTVNLLHLGFAGLSVYPIIDIGSWNEYKCEYGSPQRMHVFILVLHNQIAGYLPIRWHRNIYQHDNLLDKDGKPFETKGEELKVYTSDEFLKTTFDDEPKRLEGWGVEGICVLPKYQRLGFGKLLVETAVHYLKANLRELAFDPPLTEAGEALIKSLGLDIEEVRYTPGE